MIETIAVHIGYIALGLLPVASVGLGGWLMKNGYLGRV